MFAIIGDNESSTLMAEWDLLKCAEKDIYVPIQESPKRMLTSHWFQQMGWTKVEQYFALSLPVQRAACHSRSRFPTLPVFKMAALSKCQWETQPSGFQRALGFTDTGWSFQKALQ